MKFVYNCEVVQSESSHKSITSTGPVLCRFREGPSVTSISESISLETLGRVNMLLLSRSLFISNLTDC